MTIRSFIAAVLLTPLAALAQTTTPAEPAPAAPAATLESAKPSPWYSTVTFGGTVDAYYLLRFDAAQGTPARPLRATGPRIVNRQSSIVNRQWNRLPPAPGLRVRQRKRSPS